MEMANVIRVIKSSLHDLDVIAKICRKTTEICRIVELEEKVVKSSSLFVVVVEGLKFGGDPKSFPLKSELSLFKPLCHRV